MGADRYLECSALTGEGMDVLIEEAGAEAVRRAVVKENEQRDREEVQVQRPVKKMRFH